MSKERLEYLINKMYYNYLDRDEAQELFNYINFEFDKIERIVRYINFIGIDENNKTILEICESKGE